jgi:hypothetical protein
MFAKCLEIPRDKIMVMDNPLRKAQRGGQPGVWTKNEILQGLEYFYELNGRYPTAREIDAFIYLPSSRSIQRQFGGLVNLRQDLIPGSHMDFTKGTYRSAKAKESWDRAAQYEEEFYIFLIGHFDSVAVHEHKVMRPGNVSSDFYIYLDEDSGVVIDLFYAKDLFSLSNVVSIKHKRYINLPYETHFILIGNDNITLQDVQKLMQNKKTPLPSHIAVDTELNFKSSTIYNIKLRSNYSRN